MIKYQVRAFSSDRGIFSLAERIEAWIDRKEYHNIIIDTMTQTETDDYIKVIIIFHEGT